jgi:hypothetical protein
MYVIFVVFVPFVSEREAVAAGEAASERRSRGVGAPRGEAPRVSE